jgi:4-amino-4-deoxy-L-arabinose transferase-like glycosyltransferase
MTRTPGALALETAVPTAIGRFALTAGLSAVVAMLVAAPLLFAGLGRAPFDDPGEGMHAEIARELAESRDPLALTLNGVRYIDKPPLLYVLIAAVCAVAGPSEAAARAVSACAAVAAVGATAWLGARLLGLRGGLTAGVALLTGIGFFAYGRYVRPETLFVAALAGGFALCLIGIRDGRRGFCTAGLAVFGLAALAKDPLGALLPPLAIGAAMVLAGRVRPVSAWLPWSGVVACLVIGFGWWIGAELRTPGFGWYTAIDNHVMNVARVRQYADEDIPLTALEFLAVTIGSTLPWVIAASVAVWPLTRRRAWRDPAETPWIALAIWVVGVIGITTLSPFRLPHYGLPASFGIALLAARGFELHSGRRLLLAHVIFFAAAAVGCWVTWMGDGGVLTRVMDVTDVATMKSAAAGLPLPVPPWDEFRPVFWVAALTFALCALATAAVLVLAGSPERRRRLGVLVVGVTMIATMPGVTRSLGVVVRHRAVRDLAQSVARLAAPDDIVAHEGPIENSGALEWYSGRRPVLVDGRRSVLGFGAERPESRDLFWDAARLRQAWTSGRRVWVVSVRSPAHSLVAELPGARLLGVAGGRALWVNEIR